MKRLTLEEIEPNMPVRYIPMHARDDLSHPDVEDGIVSSKNDSFVFVKFHRQVADLGWQGATAQSCKPENLVRG